MSDRKSVALLPQGTVSDEAVRHMFRGQDVEFVYCKMIADVFQSTAKGHTDWSVIPIENTIDGSVSLHIDWLVHEVDLPIRAEWVFPSIQNLIGSASELAGEDGQWDPNKIKKIMSHPDNLDTVNGLYAAFGAGDPKILFGLLDPGIEWAAPGSAPWCGEGRGLEYVAHFTHVFTLAGGKITAHREYIDTQAIADAFRS